MKLAAKCARVILLCIVGLVLSYYLVALTANQVGTDISFRNIRESELGKGRLYVGICTVVNSYLKDYNSLPYWINKLDYLKTGDEGEIVVTAVAEDATLIPDDGGVLMVYLVLFLLAAGVILTSALLFHSLLPSFFLSAAGIGLILLCGHGVKYHILISIILSLIILNWQIHAEDFSPAHILACAIGLIFTAALPGIVPLESFPENTREIKNSVLDWFEEWHLMSLTAENQDPDRVGINSKPNTEPETTKADGAGQNKVEEDENGPENSGTDESSQEADGHKERETKDADSEDDGWKETVPDDTEPEDAEKNDPDKDKPESVSLEALPYTITSTLSDNPKEPISDDGESFQNAVSGLPQDKGTETISSGEVTGGISGGRTDLSGNLKPAGTTVMTLYADERPAKTQYISVYTAEVYENNRWNQAEKNADLSWESDIYRSVPDCLCEAFQEYFPELYQDTVVRAGTEEKTELVASLLRETAYYTLTPGSIPEGQDFIKWFLLTARKGYCIHFASAGVMMLRECGFASRYAEGYYVPLSAWRQTEDGSWTAEVKDNNAHAWAEIYDEESGSWVPVELTPSYSGQITTIFADQQDVYIGKNKIPAAVIWTMKTAIKILLAAAGVFAGLKASLTLRERYLTQSADPRRNVRNMLRLVMQRRTWEKASPDDEEKFRQLQVLAQEASFARTFTERQYRTARALYRSLKR